jgi:glycosyltransferase involved in cell wall biosynthesis
MKILLAAASFASNISGIQRHALSLARCLLLRPEVSALHLVVSPWQSDFAQIAGLSSDARLSTHIADISHNAISRNLWYYRRLPELAAQLQSDIVHLSFPVPCNGAAFNCPTVVTLHDMYPYEIPMNFGFPKFIFNRVILQQCIRSVDAIACVSDATQNRLKQYAPSSVWKKAVRIYNCVEPEPVSAADSPIPGWTGKPFLLCVAQHRRNKNIATLIRSFHSLMRSGEIEAGFKLVVVGIRGPESGNIKRLVANCGLSGNVVFLQGLTEPALQWCYRHCAVLVAPSLTEGFGLPVAEGLLAGSSIICSDIPAHREIADGYCHFVSLRTYPVEALAAAIADTLHEPKGEAISIPRLSASALAEQYIALYRRLVTSSALAQNARVAAGINISTSESQSL